jgi:tripartite-type tricarboxylate transporter receptor subunit TctC
MLRRSFTAIRVVSAVLLLAASALLAPGVRAEDSYPNRQITLIVPYPAGGVVDLTGRLVAETMREKFGQPVVVLNKPGANGMIGLSELLRTPADGYTLLVNTDGGIAIPPAVDPNFKWDPMKDFTPVAQVGEFTWVVLVNSQLPVKTMQEFVAYAKAHSGSLAYGTPGIGTLPHMATEMLMKQIGVKMTHVPYKGSAPAINDLMAGVLAMNIQSIPTVIGLTANDRLRFLAVLNDTRVKGLPDVPTMHESGLDGLVISSWNGIFAPPNLPPAIRDKIAQAMAEAVKTPKVQARFKSLSLDPIATDAPTFAKRYYGEVAKWRAFAAESNIKIAQ